MKHLFVPYEIARQLKDKGFNEPCFGYYRPMKDWMMKGTKFNPDPHFHGCNWCNDDCTFYFMYVQNSFGDRDAVCINSKLKDVNISSPLFQQVIDWFREKHGIYFQEMITEENIGKYAVVNFEQKKVYGIYDRIKAIEAAIKLI